MSTAPQKEILRRTIQSLEASCRAHPENPKLAQQLAQAYYKAGQFHPRAIQLYEAVSEVFPTDVRVQRAVSIGYMVNMGAALLEEIKTLSDVDPARLDRSIDQMRQLNRDYPDSPDILRALGDLLLVRGEYRGAVQSYRSALALGLDDLVPVCMHFERLDALADLPPGVVGFYAELCQRAGRMQEAGNLYRRLVAEGEADPGMLEAYQGFLTRRLEQVRDDSGARAENLRQLAEVALARGNSQEALAWTHQLAPEAVAASPRLVKRLSRLLIDMEDYRQAFDFLSKIQMDAEAKALLNEITVHMEKRGELDTAV